MMKPLLVGIKVEALFHWLEEDGEHLAPPSTLVTLTFRTLTEFAAHAGQQLRERWHTLKESGPPADTPVG